MGRNSYNMFKLYCQPHTNVYRWHDRDHFKAWKPVFSSSSDLAPRTFRQVPPNVTLGQLSVVFVHSKKSNRVCPKCTTVFPSETSHKYWVYAEENSVFFSPELGVVLTCPQSDKALYVLEMVLFINHSRKYRVMRASLSSASQ